MKRRVILGLCSVALFALAITSLAQAALPSSFPGGRDPRASVMPGYTFTEITENGFGDPQNNYAWSMEEFNGDIYVGTGRSVDTFNIMWEQFWAAAVPGMRPPELPDVDHPPFLQDFLQRDPTYGYLVNDETELQEWVSRSQAEIWRYHNGKWTRVYRAPIVASYLRNVTDPTVLGGYEVAKTSGFRSMIKFTDKKGTRALYATSGGFSFAIPSQQQMLYRTTDGTTWTTLATPAGMGRESRATAVLNGKLYIGVGGGAGAVHPSVWCSDDPASGNWTKVMDFTEPGLDSGNQGITMLCAFNNKLYVGTSNKAGYQIYRSTTGAPAGNASWEQIVADGAGDRYNVNAQTMKVFNGMLYVASVSLPFISGYDAFKGFELIRVHANDDWELVIGGPISVDPSPGYPRQDPISGLPAGFGNPLAFYGWSMEVYGGYLYLGTLDTSVFLRYLPLDEVDWPVDPEVITSITDAVLGCDLWRSKDGKTWSPVTKNGFNTPENYGVRTMKATTKGLYLGTANPFDGCEVWFSKSGL
jgi:hypothetical protein